MPESAIRINSAAVTQRLTDNLRLDEPVSVLRYVSKARLQGLERLGIQTLGDLVNHYPFRYNDFSQTVPIALASLSEKSTVLGLIHEITVKRPRPRLTIIEVTLVDESGMCILSFFNQPWLAKQLQAGLRLICLGQMEHSYGYRRMSSPLFSVVEQADSAQTIQAVYRANSDISQGWLRRLIDQALEQCGEMLDPLPASLRIQQGLVNKRSAIWSVHHPSCSDDYHLARQRLAYEEIFMLQLYLQQQRAQTELAALEVDQQNQASDAAVKQSWTVQGQAVMTLPGILPFQLTDDQQSVIGEIFDDLKALRPMSRLLMGDVGSGKTVVALHALAAAADSSRQAAMMAPTEILARQYASQLGPWLDRLGISWALLTSATSAAERNEILAALCTGSLSVLFGTHALIEADVAFAKLALVVIDEQHRFGVNQREALRGKGRGVHYLAMTATPIPRSLALTIYGDQDISTIRSRPRADAKISTRVLTRRQIASAYDAVRKALSKGQQAYIVCPLIGQSSSAAKSQPEQDLDSLEQAVELFTEFSESGSEDLAAAQKEREVLAHQVFPEHRVSLLTSKLPTAEKQQVMADFRAGRIAVLVSTTVIEVGVDVPNATVMIILDADRFGLSQLHQLRGRVGRGEHDGQVFLVSGTNSTEAKTRLSLLEKSSDGFALAQADLELRQEGDILGFRQHGKGVLKLIQVIRDSELIQSAHTEAKSLLEADPGLEQPEHALLADQLQRLTQLWQADNTEEEQ